MVASYLAEVLPIPKLELVFVIQQLLEDDRIEIDHCSFKAYLVGVIMELPFQAHLQLLFL